MRSKAAQTDGVSPPPEDPALGVTAVCISPRISRKHRRTRVDREDFGAPGHGGGRSITGAAARKGEGAAHSSAVVVSFHGEIGRLRLLRKE